MDKITLNEKDKAILALLELNADSESLLISKRTNLTERSVQYSISKLKSQLNIQWSPFIDIYKLGYFWVALFVSFTGQKDSKQKLINKILKESSLGWLAELSGNYQLGLAFAVKHISEINEIINRLLTANNSLITEKSIAIRDSIYDLPSGYLSTAKSKHFLHAGGMESELSHDNLDKQVLSALSNDWQGSYRRTALKTGLSPSSFDLRLRKLREKKILQGARLDFDTKLLGMQSFKLLVFLRGSRSSIIKDLFNYCLESPYIVHFVENIGAWDFEINIEVPDSAISGQIICTLQELFFPEILQIKALSIIKVHTVNRFPYKQIKK